MNTSGIHEQLLAQIADENPEQAADLLRPHLRTLGRICASAALDGDEHTLASLQQFATSRAPLPGDDAEREFARGAMEMLAALTGSALRELESKRVMVDVEAGSLNHRVLILLEQLPACSPEQLHNRLGVEEQSVVQALNVLQTHDLAREIEPGPMSAWQIMARGERVLDSVGRS